MLIISMNEKKKKKKALDKTQHPYLAKVKDRPAWTSQSPEERLQSSNLL